MIRLLASVIVQECDSQARELDYIQAEDRLANPTRFPLTTLSIGAVRIAPGEFDRPEDVASAAASAKHYAKKIERGPVRARK